jgi:predicted Zn-ribbon and HTH transcriptional regulator
MAKAPILVQTPEDCSQLLAAVAVALGLMRLAKVDRWADMASGAGASVALDHTQAALVRSVGPLLGLIHLNPTVTAAQCPRCEGYEFIRSSVSVPARCPLTRGCTGKLAKAKVATRAKPAAPSTASSTDDDRAR